MGLGRATQVVNALGRGAHIAGRTVRLIAIEAVAVHALFHDLLDLTPGIAVVDGVKAVHALEALVGGVVGNTGARLKIVGMVVPHS